MLRPGARVNRFEEKAAFKVTKAWVNRLIGDQQPDVTTKYTFADVKPYNANSPLLPSGLLGPVQLYSVVRRQRETESTGRLSKTAEQLCQGKVESS